MDGAINSSRVAYYSRLQAWWGSLEVPSVETHVPHANHAPVRICSRLIAQCARMDAWPVCKLFLPIPEEKEIWSVLPV